MKELQKFSFTPKHQRKGQPTVTFQLSPLLHGAWMYIKGEMKRGRGGLTLTPEGYAEAWRSGIVGWTGLEVEFSEDAKFDLINGAANRHVGIWQEEIAGELIRRVLVGDPEVKNS